MLSIRRVIQTWWPLAASWLLMAAELPVLSAFVARLPNPEINLAAYGGVVFPLALIIESPVIMLLGASTALSKDWDSFARLRTYMMRLGFVLTIVHLVVVLTPLYYVVVRGVLGAPEAIIEPARTGLLIMTPWTWSIAYRRFHQGVLIRFNRSKAVGTGTLVRLVTNVLILVAGFMIGTLPGIIVATSAVAMAVIAEAIYVGFIIRPVLAGDLRSAAPLATPLTLQSFLVFYIPLILTSLLTLLVQPIGSAAISRMPQALSSLAAWPVVSGLVFLFRSSGMAYNEVVVALLDEPGAVPVLRRFTLILAGVTSIGLLVLTATPLNRLWFGVISGLNPELVDLASSSLWLALLLPGLNVIQSWYQGTLLNGRATRGISEAVGIFLLVCTIILGIGVAVGTYPGINVGWIAFTAAMIAQTGWLSWRCRPVIHALQANQAS